MVKSLIEIMSRNRIATVAEGIDSEEQSRVCRDLGFDLAQGRFFGSPAAAGVLAQHALSHSPAEPHS